MQRPVGPQVACGSLERAWGAQLSGQMYSTVHRPPFQASRLEAQNGPSEAYSAASDGLWPQRCSWGFICGRFSFHLEAWKAREMKKQLSTTMGFQRTLHSKLPVPWDQNIRWNYRIIKEARLPSPICQQVGICISLAGQVAWRDCCCWLPRAAPRLPQPHTALGVLGWHVTASPAANRNHWSVSQAYLRATELTTWTLRCSRPFVPRCAKGFVRTNSVVWIQQVIFKRARFLMWFKFLFPCSNLFEKIIYFFMPLQNGIQSYHTLGLFLTLGCVRNYFKSLLNAEILRSPPWSRIRSVGLSKLKNRIFKSPTIKWITHQMQQALKESLRAI